MYKHPIHLIENEWRYNICNMYKNKCTSEINEQTQTIN